MIFSGISLTSLRPCPSQIPQKGFRDSYGSFIYPPVFSFSFPPFGVLWKALPCPVSSSIVKSYLFHAGQWSCSDGHRVIPPPRVPERNRRMSTFTYAADMPHEAGEIFPAYFEYPVEAGPQLFSALCSPYCSIRLPPTFPARAFPFWIVIRMYMVRDYYLGYHIPIFIRLPAQSIFATLRRVCGTSFGLPML